jgi:hypothetical protein
MVALLGGIGYAAYLRKAKPAVYYGLATDLERFNVHNVDDGVTVD